MLKSFKKNFSVKTLQNYINGKWVNSAAKTHYQIINPVSFLLKIKATQELLAQVPETTKEEFDEAVATAKEAFKTWKDVPITKRQRYMFDYLNAIKQNEDKLVDLIISEHGKNIPDAQGDIFRGVEVVEQSCNVSSIYLGDTLENVAKCVDMYSYRVPLGVTAGVCPFNFPVMIPLWVKFYLIPLDVSSFNRLR